MVFVSICVNSAQDLPLQCCMEITVVIYVIQFVFILVKNFSFFVDIKMITQLNQLPCGQREKRRQQRPSPHRGGVPHPPPKRIFSAPWRTLGTALTRRKKTTTTNNLAGSKVRTAWMTGRNPTHLVPVPSIPTGKYV